MRRTIKYILLAAVIAATMTSCKVWEEKWDECIPLPEVAPEITPDPWEPGGEDNPETGI